jgi:hypothetical protein
LRQNIGEVPSRDSAEYASYPLPQSITAVSLSNRGVTVRVTVTSR